MGFIAGMSGDKDLQNKALKDRGDAYKAALEEVRAIALTAHPSKLTEDIVLVCDRLLDRRSETQKLQDRVAELEARLASLIVEKEFEEDSA